SQVGRRDKKVAFIQAAHCWWKEEGTEGPALGRAAAYNAARDAAHKTRTPVGDSVGGHMEVGSKILRRELSRLEVSLLRILFGIASVIVAFNNAQRTKLKP
ncbi:MAG: hypothetical protein RLN72_07965, partial [Henriciella sp.]